MKQLAAVALALGVTCAANATAAPTALADGNWIAMAISDSTGHVSSIFQGQPAQAAAEYVVMQSCRQQGAGDCKVLASGPGGCIALSLNPTHTKYHGGWGATPEAAEAAALAKSPAGGATILKDQGHCLGDI